MASTSALVDGLDGILVKQYDKYIAKALRNKCIEESILGQWDTRYSILENPLLEATTMPIDGVGAKPNIMNNYGLVLFMPYELFPYPELIYRMELQINQKGYQINACEEFMVVYGAECNPMTFVDYSLIVIINAFVVPSSWTNRTKK